MAKNPITQFNINAGKAVKALTDVTAGLKRYNTEVKNATKNHAAFNTASIKARSEITNLAKQSAKAATSMLNIHTATSAATRSITQFDIKLGKLAANTQAAAHFMLFAAKNAARLGVDLSNAASSVRSMERAIDKDTKAIKDNVAGLRAFGKALNKVTKDMQLKNNTIDKQVAAAQRDSKVTKGLSADMEFLGKIILVQLVHRAFGELIQRITDSVKAAQELQMRIGEIQTVSLEMSNGALQTAHSTEEWARSMLALSRATGIDTLDQAAGIYDALSNQVIKANQATAFMTEEMKLAITTVSTLHQAVDVTSTVINAYGKSANDAASINATLFRGVEVGKFKLEELDSSFGRTNVLAHQLGVSFQEVTGTLALLTRLGLKADVANTLLTNTFNGLIKPTKEMKVLFDEWGVSSGEAAIATFGFTGVFRKLAEVVQNGKGELTETATLFEDLRALTGASGLIKNLGGLETAINQVTNGTANYNKAFEVQQKNLGVRGKVQLEQFKQYFLIKFGLPIQRTLVEMGEWFGGAGKAVDFFVQNIRRIIIVLGAYKISTILVSAATRRLTVDTSGLTAAELARLAALRQVQAAQAAATLGMTLIISVLAEMYAQSVQAQGAMELLIVELESDAVKKAGEAFAVFNEQVDRSGEAFKKFTDDNARSWFVTIAEIRKANNLINVDFEKTFKNIHKNIKEGLDGGADVLEKQLKKIRDEIKKTEKALESAKERLAELKQDKDERELDVKLQGLDPVAKIKKIEEAKNKAFGEALLARKANEDKIADDLLKRTEKLSEMQIKLLEKIKEEAGKEVEVGAIKIDNQGGVRVRAIDGNAKRTTTLRPGTPSRVRRPRQFTIEGQAPTVKKVVDEKFKEVKNAEAVKNADAAIAQIGLQRVAQAQQLIALEQELIVVKEKNLAKQQEQEKKQEENFKRFKEAVSIVDSLNKDSDPNDVTGALLGAETAGKDAGLSNKDLFDILRDGNKLRLELARKGAKEETDARLDEIQREVLAQKKIAEEAEAARKDAIKNTQQGVSDSIVKSLTGAAEIRAALTGRRVGPKTVNQPDALGNNAAGQAEFKANIEKLNAAKRAALEVERQAQLLQTRQTDAKNGVPGATFVSPEDLANLDAANVKLAEALKQVNTIKDLRDATGFLGQTNFAGDAPRNAKGQAAFTKDGESLVDRANELQKQINLVKQSAQEAAIAQQRIDISVQAQVDAQTIRAQLEEEYGNLSKAVQQNTEAGVRAQQAINAALDVTIRQLKEIKALQGGGGGLPDEALALGGKINYRAFGGRGTDRHLTATSQGEFISTRLATRQYAPLLASLNKQPAQFRANGGSTVNFGDININAPEGTTSVQANDIATKLERLTRRRLYKK